MKLTPRLRKISDFVPENAIVADIGTDHGYIPVYLAREKNIKKIIASDLNEGPLESAKQYVKSSGLEDIVDLRLGNGMRVLRSKEVDTVIIAGMGGLLISEIMNNSREICKDIKRFILQPMVGMSELREYLEYNDYVVAEESLVEEGNKMYQILSVTHGKEKIKDDIYYEFSERLIESGDPLLPIFLSKKIDKLEEIIDNIKKKGSNENKQKIEELEIKKAKLEGVLKDAVKNNN